jgi:two-component system, chemotaxis family, chemotaxis protein CheY
MHGLAATTNRATSTAGGAPIQLRVLVVDADADTRALYQDALSVVGCEVIEASDGRDALTKALVEPPSLIITELSLPLVDGYALCEILHRDLATRAVPILVVTVEARSTELDRIRRAGASGVLVKPTPLDAIVREVRYLTTHTADPEAVAPCDPSANLRSKHPRMVLAKSHPRFRTTLPPKPPPALRCPSCDVSLAYDHSHVGGISVRNSEQWDYYVCATCGTFQYRPRTRKLRHVD